MKAFIWFAIVLTASVQGESLVEIYDTLDIKDNTTAIIASVNMTSFPYIDVYSQNASITGTICYAANFNDFNTSCYQQETTNWIILNPFVQVDSNYIIQTVSNASSNYNVNGLIFITTDFITSNQSYTLPKIISLVSTSTGDTIQQYSYTNNKTLTANLSHTFIERCYILDPIVPTYLTLSGLWLLVIIGWWVHTFMIHKQRSLYLQKTLTIIPLCKIFETLINGLYLNACPWISTQDPSEKYLDMARISIVTITYTILLALLFLMSKGWNTVVFQLSRNQATYLTMIMGAVYLTYSAFFLSIDFSGISQFMKGVMTVLYLALGFTNVKNLRESIILIKNYQAQTNQDNPNDVMLPSLKLKIRMLLQYLILIVGFFLLRIIYYGAIKFIGDDALSVRFSLSIQCFDLLFLGGTLFIFRSRRWPAFFSIGLNELGNNPWNALANGGNAGQYLAPMLETKISRKMFEEDYDDERSNSVGEEDAVIILNPTKYTLNEDEDFEEEQVQSSLNDDNDVIDHHHKVHNEVNQVEHINPSELMDSLKLAYKEKKKRRRNRESNGRSRFLNRRENNDSTDDDEESSSDESLNDNVNNNRR